LASFNALKIIENRLEPHDERHFVPKDLYISIYTKPTKYCTQRRNAAMYDDGVPTITSEDQRKLELKVRDIYADFLATGINDNDERLLLKSKIHAQYLYSGLGELPAGK
jgi:hypothetical protein